jgi:Protein of unknown function (DUF2470)
VAEPTPGPTLRIRRPSSAERARTALADARVATVTTYSRDPVAPPHQTLATVSVEENGRLAFFLEPQSWAVANLLARPLASVTVAAQQPGRAQTTNGVILRGSVRRVPSHPRPTGRPAAVPFLMEATSVRLWDGRPGSAPIAPEDVVDVESFSTAVPDPLRTEAPQVLAHLREAHGSGLLHCLRSQGHPSAEWIEPQRLDRYGLEVSVVSADAVADVRLPFPTPLDSLSQLGPGLRTALMCRCADGPDAGP